MIKNPKILFFGLDPHNNAIFISMKQRFDTGNHLSLSWLRKPQCFMTDSDLIAGCIREDKLCQKVMYGRFSGKMYALCLRYTDSREEAEDMLQDGFIKVFDSISKFRQEGSLEGWVRKIMINTALQQLKKSKLSAISLSSENNIHMSDYRDENDLNALNRISADEIIKFISELPPGYRTVFNLYAVDGYSHKEIADMLHISESTSRSQLMKARNMLQTKIKLTTTIYHHGS